MSHTVIAISEWIPKEGREDEVFEQFKGLARQTLQQEKGCLQYNVTKQIPHANANGSTNYKILLMQEFESEADFEAHCQAPYVVDLSERILSDPKTSPIEDWQLRVFEKG